MKEDVLHFIWKFQYFNNAALRSTAGKDVKVLHAGVHNLNQGPDFSGARVKIGDTIWAGNIELHLFSSDWITHGHSSDKNYSNVILHVVWEHDREIADVSGNAIPTLELKSRVPKILIDKYRRLMELPHLIPCNGHKHSLSALSILNWKERLVVERLTEKSIEVEKILQKTRFHWEETFWRIIARNFGLKVNATFFQDIAESLPLNLIKRHKHNRVQLEALLFGQGHLLSRSFSDKYPQMLKKEYEFYRKKYGLKPVEGILQFLRMRPANFPTLRLSQLAALLCESEHLFSKIKSARSANELKLLFDVTANDYWHYHYVFDQLTEYKEKRLGKQMIDNILINTVVPVVFCYGKSTNEESLCEKSLKWLEELSPEQNRITKAFTEIELENKNAFDSQALIQLKTNYCDHKRCLQCAVGTSILRD